jgi:hypothetical protein
MRVESGDHWGGGLRPEALAIVLELMNLASRPGEPERVEGDAKQLSLLGGLSLFVDPPEKLLGCEDDFSYFHGDAAVM